MKKMLTILSEGKQVNEDCGMAPTHNIAHTPPVTMSVNLNAQGIDQIKDLLSLMNKADSPLSAGPVGFSAMAMPATPMDITAMPAPKPMPMAMPTGMNKPEAPKVPDMKDLIKIASGPAPEPDDVAPKKEMQAVANQVRGLTDELANAPDPQYGDIGDAIPNGDDLHKQKGAYPKVNGGDNPMAFEQLKLDLSNLYKEIKETR